MGNLVDTNLVHLVIERTFRLTMEGPSSGAIKVRILKSGVRLASMTELMSVHWTQIARSVGQSSGSKKFRTAVLGTNLHLLRFETFRVS